MVGRTVHLRIGGQTYRVLTSASDEELQKLAAVVDKKIAAVVPAGRVVTPQAMLLAAMALAHDLEIERGRSAAIAAKARGAFGRMIERVDAALGPEAGPPVVQTIGQVGGLPQTPGHAGGHSQTPGLVAYSPTPGHPANEP